jgi:hypothetical protein
MLRRIYSSKSATESTFLEMVGYVPPLPPSLLFLSPSSTPSATYASLLLSLFYSSYFILLTIAQDLQVHYVFLSST